ncbi:MAG: metal ABC transporter ATP-binding protein [Deltaproteobacteria bacterium]|jgi:zinc transport system ATP-binding protein|nr:metal ABC transporter ATP-binding protein [Deltaproteobacteria bacterium]
MPTTESVSPPIPEKLFDAVVIKDMGVSYGSQEILKDVTTSIPMKKLTVIIGPNGAGKSTLVLAIIGAVPHTGTIEFPNTNPILSYIPQRLDFDRHLPMTVEEFMALGRTVWPMWLKCPKKLREQFLHYLGLVKARTLLKRPLGSLSGGETQRVFLARALMDKPDMLVLDEPEAGVDVYGEKLLCEILDTFKKDFTIVMVSHDLAAAKTHGDWIIGLNRTVICCGPPDNIFQKDVITSTFGLDLAALGVEEGPAGKTH